MTGESPSPNRIKAGLKCDLDENPKVFTLSFGTETVTLDPGKAWAKVDVYKWVTRGLIEEPQAFRIEPGGAVHINGDQINLSEPKGAEKLEREINKRHSPAIRPQPAMAPKSKPLVSAASGGSYKVQFKIKIDHLGHLMIQALRGSERVETGLRGIPSLIQSGLLIKPKNFHVDPLLRAIEIDGRRFECDQAGAQQLEQALNGNYAPVCQGNENNAIDVKENAAAATGFDIHFVTTRAGVRFEIKEHLSQQNLDLLQDTSKCDLLQPGIVLRLSAPYLLVRRRRRDGTEEKIPGLPDVQYRRINASQLQQVLNHPLIRRSAAKADPATAAQTEASDAEIVALRITRNPRQKQLLWMQCLTGRGGEPAGKAFTHHNVADLQHQGLFRPQLEVSLSWDNHKLHVLNTQTREEESLMIDPQSPDTDLEKASQILTAALKPPSAQPSPTPEIHPTPEEVLPRPHAEEPNANAEVQSAMTESSVIPTAKDESPAAQVLNEIVTTVALLEKTIPVSPEPPSAIERSPVAFPRTETTRDAFAGGRRETQEGAHPEKRDRPLEPSILALFAEADPRRINTEIFQSLAAQLEAEVQDVRLTLAWVFENRRFEIISSTHPHITSIDEIRSAEFDGFYLSHVSNSEIVLAYARSGKRIKWGCAKCLLQPALSAEPDQFKGSALLGMAQDQSGHFVFVVTPNYKTWAQPREKIYADAFVHFKTVAEIAADPADYALIWPEANP